MFNTNTKPVLCFFRKTAVQTTHFSIYQIISNKLDVATIILYDQDGEKNNARLLILHTPHSTAGRNQSTQRSPAVLSRMIGLPVYTGPPHSFVLSSYFMCPCTCHRHVLLKQFNTKEKGYEYLHSATCYAPFNITLNHNKT